MKPHSTIPSARSAIPAVLLTLAFAAAHAGSVAGGPLAGINVSGLATAGAVFQKTAATAQGSYSGNASTLALTVLNVSLDNFGAYAGDTLDDAWQVQYFGQPPNANAGPNADFRGTGQTNLFKYIAGLNPIHGSRFTLTIAPVPAQPAQKNLIFSPVVAGRTYTVKAKPSLTGGTWDGVTITSGTVGTITDLNATGGPSQKPKAVRPTRKCYPFDVPLSGFRSAGRW